MKFPLFESLFGIFKNKVLSIIETLDPPLKKRKVENSFCMEQILKLLKKGLGWRDCGTKEASYSTLYKRFASWNSKGVFKQVWKCLLDLYVEKKLRASKTWFKTLFIDSSMIKNIRGSDCKGRNHFDRNRYATKISIVCDKKGTPVSSSFYPANLHDVNTLETSLKRIDLDLLPDKRCLYTLVGDKGYIISHEKKEHLRFCYRTRMLTPFRKNQNKKLNKNEIGLLKNRLVIEHLFNKLDTFKKIKTREERWLNTYEGLNYLAIAILTVRNI